MLCNKDFKANNKYIVYRLHNRNLSELFLKKLYSHNYGLCKHQVRLSVIFCLFILCMCVCLSIQVVNIVCVSVC